MAVEGDGIPRWLAAKWPNSPGRTGWASPAISSAKRSNAGEGDDRVEPETEVQPEFGPGEHLQEDHPMPILAAWPRPALTVSADTVKRGGPDHASGAGLSSCRSVASVRPIGQKLRPRVEETRGYAYR